MRTVQVLLSKNWIAAQEISEHPDRFQELIAAARAKHGFAICACSTHKRKLQIRTAPQSHLLYLAVWPDDGHNHTLDCPYYRPDPATSAARWFDRDTLREDEQGRLHLSLSFSLDTQAPAAGRAGVAEGAPVNRHLVSDRVGLTGLLSLLWARARLNQWHPSWHRDWSRVRFELVRAAESIFVGRDLLSACLSVVRPYRGRVSVPGIDLRAELDADAQKNPAGRDARLLVAQMRRIATARFGFALTLGNTPKPVFLADDVWQEFQSSHPVEAASLLGAARPSGQVVGIMKVVPTGPRSVRVIDMAAMSVSNRYLPVIDPGLAPLIDALCDAERSFEVPLLYGPQRVAQPHAVLSDCASPRVILEAEGLANDPLSRSLRAMGLEEWRDEGRMVVPVSLAKPIAPQLPVPVYVQRQPDSLRAAGVDERDRRHAA